MEKDKIHSDVIDILEKVLPNTFNVIVQIRRSFDGSEHLAIGASPSTYQISGVSGQYPQFVSLRLDFFKPETVKVKKERIK